MDYSVEYVDEEAMDSDPGAIPKNLRHHPIPRGDRILHAQSLSTPPKVIIVIMVTILIIFIHVYNPLCCFLVL